MSLPAGAVVVRNPRVLVLVGVPLLAVLDAGFAWGVVASLATRDWTWPFRHDGLPTWGMVTGWVVTLLLFSLCAVSLWTLPWFREVFLPDRVLVRLFGRSRAIQVAELTSVRVTRTRVHTGTRTIGYQRLVIESRHGNRRRRAILDQSLTNADAALPVLEGWLRARPDLVGDAATRDVFRARGLDLPDPSPAR